MSGLLNKEGVMKVPPSFNHIFEKENIKYITYHFHPTKSSIWRDDKYHEALVHLKTDGASSTVKFFDNDQQALTKQVEEFINNLK